MIRLQNTDPIRVCDLRRRPYCSPRVRCSHQFRRRDTARVENTYRVELVNVATRA